MRRAEPVFGAIDDLASIDPSFQPGMEFLTGFDRPHVGESWQPDDWVLLGVKLTHDDQESVWFVRMSTLPPKVDAEGNPIPSKVREFSVPFGVGSIKPRARFALPVGRICIETYAHDGTFMQSSVRMIPQAPRMTSLLEMCQDLQANLEQPKVEMTPAPADSAKSMASLAVMLQTIGMCAALEPIREAVREQVLKLPNVFDVIFSGLRVRLETQMSPSEPLFMPWTSGVAIGPCEQIRFPMCLAGQPLANCRLISGPIAPPYHLTAGMLLLEAVHPDKPQNRLTMRVLAAKRLGPSPGAEGCETQN